MPRTLGGFRNDGDDGDRNDGDDGDDGDRSGTGARTNGLLAQALWRTRGGLTRGIDDIGNPKWTPTALDKEVFGRWGRDVRAHMFSFELLSGLYFDSTRQGKASLYAVDLGRRGGTVSVRIRGRGSYLIHTLEQPLFDKDEDEFERELTKVLRKTALRAERLPEILTQVFLPYSFYAMLLNMQPGRHRHTRELMSAVWALSSTVVMQFKHHLRVRRPSDRSPLVQPVILVPGHGTYPAGHATQNHFVATVLEALVGNALGDDLKVQLHALATRIAENRVVAGLHYEKDNEAGKALGIELAKYFQNRAKVPGSALRWLWKSAQDEWTKNI